MTGRLTILEKTMHTLTRGMAAILSTLAIMAAAHAAQVSVHDPVMAK